MTNAGRDTRNNNGLGREYKSMSKRKSAKYKNVLSWIARGDGQGKGPRYRPFLRVRDVPSLGRSSMVLGLKTGRVHHYLSDMEYAFHILAEFEPDITDIREQYALLPWEETQEIARELGIRHPIYPGTKTPIVMTSDLVLTSRHKGSGVICVKPSSRLNPQDRKTKRVLEKLLIEKTYWSRRGLAWSIATEKDIPKTRVRNLDMLRVSLIAKELDWLMPYMPSFIEAFEYSWQPELALGDILNRICVCIGLDKPYCFALFGRAVWLRLVHVDLDTAVIKHEFPIKLRRLPCLASTVS